MRPTASRVSASRSTVVSTAAILSALRDATGRELTRIPVRPDDIALPAAKREQCSDREQQHAEHAAR